MSLIAAKTLKETPKAILLSVKAHEFDTEVTAWFPKSQLNRIGYIPGEPDYPVYEVATWLIREKKMSKHEINNVTDVWFADSLAV